MSGWSFGLLSGQALLWSLGAAAALTIFLYLLKLKRRPVVVPFIEIWQSLLFDKKATALHSQLRRLLSLLLSLLLIAALILAFSDPRSPNERRGRHLLVLIDAGLSMSTPISGRTRTCLDEARSKVEGWFESLGPGDEMLLVEMGDHPRPLDAFSKDPLQLKAALQRIRPLDVNPNLKAGLAFSKDVLAGRTAPEVLIVSARHLNALAGADAAIEDVPPLSFVDVSDLCLPPTNEAFADELLIELFSARRYPLAADRFEALLVVSTEADQPVDAEISIYSVKEDGERGGLLEVVQRTIQPGPAQTLTFVNLGQAETGLIAEVMRLDKKPEKILQNNVARTVLSPRLPVRVLLVGPPDNFLQAALLIEDSLIVEQVAAEDYPPAGTFDVTIISGVPAPPRENMGAMVHLGVPPVEDLPQKVDGYPVEVKEKMSMFGFDTWDKASRVFQLIDPYDVQVLSGYHLVPQSGDHVLGRSQGRPILVSGSRQGHRFLALGFDPKQSDFVLRPAWPLFVINLIDELYPRGRGDTVSTGRAGEDLRVAVADVDARAAKVRGPLSGGREVPEQTVPVLDGYAVFDSQQAGFFDVATTTGTTRIAIAPQVPRRFDSNSNAAEHVEPKGGLRLGPYTVQPPSGMEPRSNYDPWFWLLAGVFVVSYLEWWSYHRRWTV